MSQLRMGIFRGNKIIQYLVSPPFFLYCFFALLLVNLFVSKVEISKYNLRLSAPIYLSEMIELTLYIPNEQFNF